MGYNLETFSCLVAKMYPLALLGPVSGTSTQVKDYNSQLQKIIFHFNEFVFNLISHVKEQR